ncbi:hypothetical protein NQ317_007095, partial [Molorchus minor]
MSETEKKLSEINSAAWEIRTTWRMMLQTKKRPIYRFSDFLGVAEKIWPIMLMVIFAMLTMAPTHPSVTSLVVSDNYGNGSQWSDKYFVPVVTFLFVEICSLIGRLSMTITIRPSTRLFWVAFMFLRMIIFVPLLLLCNAQPRHNLPVVFDKDWEYAIIMAVFAFFNGYSFNLTFLSAP